MNLAEIMKYIDDEALKIINEIKALNVHTWWGLCLSNRIADLVWGKDRPVLTPQQIEDCDEFYMAIFSEQKQAYIKPNDGITI